MFRKIIANIINGISSKQLQKIFAAAAKESEKRGYEILIRFSVDELGKFENYAPSINITRKQDRIVAPLVSKYAGKYFVDAHYHRNGDLEMSSTDKKTVKNCPNIFAVIVYTDNGEYRLYKNPHFDTNKTTDYDPEYEYCNIKRVAGLSIAKIIGINNDQMRKIADKLEDQLLSLETKIRKFCGEKEDENSLPGKIKKWLRNKFGSAAEDIIDNLSFDDHDLSHVIEDFMEKYPDFRNYKNEQELNKLADMLAGKIYGIGYDLDTSDMDFKTELLDAVKKSLTDGGKDSFVDSVITDLNSIKQKSEEILASENQHNNGAGKNGGKTGGSAPANIDLDQNNNNARGA
ncbi:MAG: hypothetical protein PHV30_03725 [Candidatus Margulisbacteria bacterium]|nr:hypothetical protein [Candidatus Margulisiibacteriota bacterium]